MIPRQTRRAHPSETQAASPSSALQGCTLIWTRPAENTKNLAEALAQAGAEILEAPAIELAVFVEQNLAQCRVVLEELRNQQGWLILPSPAAIRAFGEVLSRLDLQSAGLTGLRVAVIGQASAEALAGIGLHADFLPPSPRGSALAETLPAEWGTPVVIAGSSQTRPELREGLMERGLRVQTLPLYAPAPCRKGLKAIAQALSEAPGRVIVVTSPSAVDAIMESLGEEKELLAGAMWVALGPSTLSRLWDWKVDPERAAAAASPSAEGIIGAVQAVLARAGSPEDQAQ